jgi:uncharacterized protein DUF4115
VLYILGSGGTNKASPPTGTRATGTHGKPHRQRQIPAAPAARPKAVKLQLVPTGTVYVCVMDGKGAKLIPGLIFNAGQTIPAQSGPKLLVTLGNASVQMKVNGATVHVPQANTSIGFLLQPGGTTSLPVSKQPRCV